MMTKIFKIQTMILLSCFFWGCTTTSYIGVQPLPNKPIFTIIPVTLKVADLKHVSDIQECLLQHGLTVIERPAIIEVFTADQSIGTSESQSNISKSKGQGSGERTTDIVYSFSKTTADIIIVVNSLTNVIQIIKKEGNVYLATKRFSYYDDKQWGCFTINSLVALKIINNSLLKCRYIDTIP